jgi:MoaA/NifB/PqqE/SkfB family radical SAM enzyme
MNPPLRENQLNRYRAMREFAVGAAELRTTPPSLQIARTNDCNFTCAYCSDHRDGTQVPRTELAGDTWQGLLDLIPRSTSMAFHGISEFLVDKHFFDIVGRCAAAGVELSINTNGSVCTPKYVDTFVAYPGPLHFNVSIDAASEATYRRIRGWDWDRLLRNIATYVAAFARRQAPTKTTLSYVIFASNLHETAAVVELAARLGIGGVKFYRLHEYSGLDWVVPTEHGGDFDYRAEQTSRVPAMYDAAIDAAEKAARATGITIELPARYGSEARS